MDKMELLEKIVYAEYKNAVGRLHFCNYVSGFVGDTDEQVEVVLDPPALVIVEKDENGLMNYNDTHLDPYWSVKLARSDSRLNNLRSMWTYGSSYCLKTGKLEEDSIAIWLAPENWIQFLIRKLCLLFRRGWS